MGSILVLALLGLSVWPVIAASEPGDPHAIIRRMATAYEGIRDYTAMFLKRERIDGQIQPLETIELRFQEPFKVYMAWREPHPGRVITYIEGENEDKLQVNPGGALQFLRLALDPEGALATRGSHASVRRVGLRNTITLLTEQYQRGMREGRIALHFRGDKPVDARPAYHLEWIGPDNKNAGYYAYRGDVWVDKESYLPIQMDIYDWENQLHASYAYHRLQLNPGLTREDFTLPPVTAAPTQATRDQGASQ
jgi:outer membrane lipoprotein-sorting protein